MARLPSKPTSTPPASRRKGKPAAAAKPSDSRALVWVDSAPLQRAAWVEYRVAQRRHDQAARDLHRHENVDMPAYHTWLHQTFPQLVTTLRTLHAEVSDLQYRVQTAEALAAWTGRPVRKIWQEQKEYEKNPDRFKEEPEPPEAGEDAFDDDGTASEPRARRFRGDNRARGGGQEDGARAGGPREQEPGEAPSAARDVSASTSARDVYRRLVSRLHPDRGGAWTPARERLWHEVQRAWESGDADWLMRLEVEWEAANDVLGPDSPISRLKRAIQELQAARRDLERKLRVYRKSVPWRFTQTAAKRYELEERIEADLRHDITLLQHEARRLDQLVASWERKRGSRARDRWD